MEMNDYQEQALTTAQYPKVFVFADRELRSANWIYPALGLGGETGEILEKAKKLLRDRGGKINGEDRELMSKELGDVLWYVAVLAKEFGISLDHVAKLNLDKLRDRKERGVIGGSGDER